MSFAFRLCWCLLALSLSFHGLSRQSSASAAQTSADETGLRALAETFFNRWAAKDLDGFLRLWSAQSPELEARKKATQELFASSEKILLKSFAVRQVKVDGDNARVRVEADVQVVETRTGKEKSGYGKMLRTLECVKEGGAWKVARELATASDLVASLAAAANEEARSALLADHADVPEKELLEALLTQSRQLRGRGKLDEAETLLLLAQARAEKTGEQRLLVLIWLNLGENFFRRTDYDRALGLYQQALTLAETLGGKAEIAGALRSIGTIHEVRGNYAVALEHYQKALPMAEAAGEPRFVAAMHQDAARIQVRRGEFQSALRGFQQSLAAYEALDEKIGASFALDWLSRVSRIQGDYAEALRYTERQLTLAEAASSPERIAGALNELGNLKFLQGDMSAATDYYQRTIALYEKLKAPDDIAANLLNLANVSKLQGDFEAAFGYSQRSLAIARDLNLPPRVALAYMNLASLHTAQGNFGKALETYQQVLQIEEKLERKAELALCLGHIATVQRLQGNFDLALEYLQRSQKLNESQGLKLQIAQNLAEIGNVHAARHDLPRALAAYQQGFALAEALNDQRLLAELHNSLGAIYQTQGNYAAAQEQFTRSLALNETVGQVYERVRSYLSLGGLSYAQGRPAEALAQLERARPLADKDVEADLRWRVHYLAGRSHLALGQAAAARQELSQAITLIETMRDQSSGAAQTRQEFLGTRLGPYHAMLESAQSQPPEALSWAERSKARVLLDVLQGGKAEMPHHLTESEQGQERILKRELTALNLQLANATQSPKPAPARINDLKTRLAQARLNYEVFQTALYAAHPELKVQRGQAPIIKSEELAALLPDSASALLEYVVTDDQAYLFVVTKAASQTGADIQLHKLPVKREDLARQTESFRQQLAGRELGFRAAAARLHDLLLKPAAAQLRGKTKLIIVPDDKLWELPFQALLTGENRFLIEQAALSYAPSLSVLREMRKRQRQPAGASSATLLALGNPRLGQATIERATLALRDEKLAPLPEAEQEVKALGQLFGATRSKVYVGAEAREERAKTEAGQARVLHFATHGILNNAAPLYSHLVLASDGKNEDGLLEAWELMRLDLRADLAVLSACETARGRIGAGEGLIGLTWALFVAGVPSTVVSQWKVESAGTRDLMLNFHRQLRAPARATKAEALRQAALKLLKQTETSHPFYWAGFVLVGDGR